MTYSIYLRHHDGSQRLEDQTRTGDPVVAIAAFRTLLARRDLDGRQAGVVLRDQSAGRTLYYSRFDHPEQQLFPEDAIHIGPAVDDPDSATCKVVADRGKITAPSAGMPDTPPLPDLLKAYRTKIGVTQEKLAARWGVSLAWVKKAERGLTVGTDQALRDLLAQVVTD